MSSRLIGSRQCGPQRDRNILDENVGRQYEYGAESDNGYVNRPSAQGFNSKAKLLNNKADQPSHIIA